jgi:hypothetical protein
LLRDVVNRSASALFDARVLAAPAESTECVPQGAAPVSGEAQRGELPAYLSRRLLQPLAPAIAGHRRIVLSPDAAFWMLLWDVMLLNHRPLVQVVELSQVHSLSVYKQVRARQVDYVRTSADPETKRLGLLAFGNPDYGSDASDMRRASIRRSPLRTSCQGAQDQVDLQRLIWQQLPQSQHEMAAGESLFHRDGARIVSGAQATETQLRAMSDQGELRRYQHLLFSAHGYFDPNQPALSSLVLRPQGPEPERDGYVMVSEWSSMQLRGDRAIRSACNTARGKSVNAEGMLGLSYSLFAACNNNTLLTLWPVHDSATAGFVVSFLKKVRAGLPHASALAATKREFMKHPQVSWRPAIKRCSVLNSAPLSGEPSRRASARLARHDHDVPARQRRPTGQAGGRSVRGAAFVA